MFPPLNSILGRNSAYEYGACIPPPNDYLDEEDINYLLIEIRW